MSNSFSIVGAHWYNRHERLEVCTKTLLNFLLKIKQHNSELFDNWYEKGYSRREALNKKVNLDYNNIKRLLSKKGLDDDYPEISFRTGIWNGNDNEEESVSLSVCLGSNEKKYFTNNCVIQLPHKGKQFDYYQLEENQKDLINILKKTWNPDWVQIDNRRIY